MDRGDLPDVVRLPDGRTEPFEPERITRSLFEAAGRVGKADPFLARELTEGVLHFLAADRSGSAVSPTEIAEVVGKVVRELGHPELARAFESRSATPERASPSRPDWPTWVRPADGPSGLARAAAAGPLEAFSLTSLFPPELASAHAEGLIRLTGLATPFELAGVTAGLPPLGVLEAVRRARDVAGEFLSVDGPEYDLAAESGDPDRLAAGFLREAGFAAQALGLTVVLNLNIQAPPPRLAGGSGPLFQPDPAAEAERRTAIAVHLAAGAPASGLEVWWHLSDDLSRLPPAGGPCELVFDRPRGPVALAPGIDRDRPASLAVVGVNLERLVELTGGPPVDPVVFLKKVASLARFAKTAGHVKQDFLRRHGRPGVREAFLLDRARLVLVPFGLREAAQSSDRPAGEFARDILKALRTAADTDRPRSLPVRVDSPLGDWGEFALAEPDVPAKAQVRAASPLHQAAGGGRLDLRRPEGDSDPEVLREAVRAAGAGSVARIRLGE